ncbi:TRAP-type mannitol/chloroaromatic compound transport system permease small subunit [Catalinimonas alkaloidigena]|uniref:TRAP transporter small permease subunit n=1 Tax=Catalinimonas alkaloidigena TaxID=1075417 RepID=UPI00240612A3|nr:TRAP transporter small permease subunit [Catalinimonas alkaloidigena]MDF9800696.1 TRAP-type mannitol/chloroaromatic compound transport system permease small subunit [Catalinimonas alkaloidigena]
MRKTLESASNFIDGMNEAIGKGVSWLNTLLVILICYDVAARYLFNTSSSGIVELEWHIFSFIFLLGAAYALKHDKHVRVDVFYQNFSPKKQAWVNLIGTLLFLIPFCIITIQSSLKFTANAYAINEGSPDPGGLPARFIVKGAIPVGFFLLLLQAFSLAFRSLLTVTESTNSDHA